MATSGAFNTTAYNTSSSGNRFLTFTWSRQSYSVEKNTSTISYTLKGNGTYSGYINTRNITLTINGTTVYTTGNDPIQLRNGTVLKSGTITISHNSDGTKSFTASAKAGIYTSAINSTGSGTFTLDTIPRKSTVTATNGNIGNTTSITISRASSSFTHTLTWACGTASGTFATKTTATSLSATIPTSIYATIPNAKTAKVTVTCTTYNGNTSLGSTSCEFTATADEKSCKPSVASTSLVDINATSIAVTGDSTKFIKGVSNARISGASATAKNSATLKSLVFKCGTASANASSGTATINAISSGTFTLTATDSRGYSTTETYNPTAYDYSKPTITAKAYSPQQTGREIKADISGKYSTGISTNTVTVDYRYSENGGTPTDWATLAPTISNGNYSGSVSLGNTFDYRNEYKFEFRATDVLNTITYPVTVIRGVPVFDWGENDFNFNKNVGFESGEQSAEKSITFKNENGTYPHNAKLYGGNPNSKVAIGLYDSKQSKPIIQYCDADDLQGLLIMGEKWDDFVVKQGTSGIWSYRKWNSGKAECWGTWSGTLSHYHTINGFYAYYTNISFPTGLFNATPVPTYSSGVGSVFAFSGNLGTLSKTDMNCYALASSGGSQSVKFCIHAYGTWK